MIYEIEKEVPVPVWKDNPFGRKSKYPFHGMEVGDSFLADTENAVRAAQHHGKKYNRAFRSQKERGGWRIWRIK